jgi:hypothetical protein
MQFKQSSGRIVMVFNITLEIDNYQLTCRNIPLESDQLQAFTKCTLLNHLGYLI